MKGLKDFNIQFVGLKEGSHLFEYQIDKLFFDFFNFDEFLDADVKIVLDFEKKSTLLNLSFTSKGTVTVPCDVTNEPYKQPVNGNLSLVVKFGPEFNDDNDEVLVIPHEEYQINVSQYIYEMIVLAVPSKRIHPKVLDGTMKSETLEKLKELEIDKKKNIEETDPRWDKLKDLLTKNNT